MVQRLRLLERIGDEATIDADTHISSPDACDAARRGHSDDYFHGKPVTAEELLAELDAAEVDVALCWQNPAATPYGKNPTDAFMALRGANEYVDQTSRRYPDRFIPAGWTDPKALGIEGARTMVDLCVGAFGFAVVKINPAQNGFPIDGAEVIAVVDRIVEWGAIPAFHFGSDTPYTPVSGLERIAARIAPAPLIAVHMGGGGASYLEAESTYLETRRLGLRRSNIFFVCSARRDTHTESDLISYQLAGEPYNRNIALGSDAPYGRVAWNFGGYRAMFKGLSDRELAKRHLDSRVRARPELFGAAAIRNYMGRNIAELVAGAYRRVLSRNAEQ